MLVAEWRHRSTSVFSLLSCSENRVLDKRAKTLAVAISASPGTVKAGRDEQRVRQRYLRMGKEALIERLIVAERTLAEQRERWLGQQDEALTWRLRAETAETQLQEYKARTERREQ